MFKVNLKGVSMDNYTLLENGDYPFQIVAAEEAVSKSSGNDMVVITLEERQSGAKLKDYLVVEGDNLSKLKKFLCEIGQEYDEDGLEIDCKNWIGLWVMANVIVEDYVKKDGTAGKSNEIRYYTKYVENASMVEQIKERNASADLDEEVPF